MTATIRDARNYIDAPTSFATTDSLVELWAAARTAFSPELPDVEWFGRKD